MTDTQSTSSEFAVTSLDAPLSYGRHKRLSDLRLAGFAAASVALLSAVAALIFVFKGNDVAHLYRDAASITGAPSYLGAFSYMGEGLLVAAAAVAAFAVVCGAKDRGLFAAGALFSLVLAVDDLFMLHERELPGRFGISEHSVFVFYALAAAVLLGMMLWRWGWSRMTLFGISMGFFAGSLAVDLLDGLAVELIWIEDTAKLCGMAVWCAAWGRAARIGLFGDASEDSAEAV